MKIQETLTTVWSATEMIRPGEGTGAALAVGTILVALAAPPVAAGCGGVTTVENEAGLNAAIETFNADTTAEACVYTIQLGADIDLRESTTSIQNVISGKSMIIEGGGFQVDGQDGAFVQGFDGLQPFAIEAGTVVTMNDLTVTGGKPVGGGALKRGGGIRNEGTLRLNRSTVAGNETDSRGGGIANRGTLVIDSSTISGNVSGAGVGGGIYSEGGSVTITNSTISGNEADSGEVNDVGGGIFASGSLTLDSVTITDNFSEAGSGIYVDTADGDLTVGNTILSDNFPQADCYFDASGSGRVLDQGYNLFVGTDGCGFLPGDNNNILSPAFLEPLADNGGPTQTHAPQLVSPAIDAGSTSLGVDQRGAARPSGAAPDIGAYETQGCGDSPWSATNLAELNVAIECFNGKTDPGVYIISIDHGISATASTTPIDNDTVGAELVIQGNGNSGDWNGNLFDNVRPFRIEAGSTVTINDFSIIGGNVPDFEQGGGILNHGDLTLVRCTVIESTAYRGGGIFNANGGSLTVFDSTIARNEARDGGGGIYSLGTSAPTPLSLTNSTVSGNVTPVGSGTAGGVVILGATATADIDSATIADNRGGVATSSGIAVGAGASAMLTNTIMADNGPGGDCYFISVSGSTIDGDHNLIEDDSGCASPMTDTLVGEDPLLGILRNNGGPTRTHALLAGSPAIDAGDTDLDSDQRGYARPSGAADDIGAFEEAQVGTITIVKQTPVQSIDDYNFTLDGDQLTAPILFSLDTSQNDLDGEGEFTNRAVFGQLEAGDYTVTEDVPAKQKLGPVAIACEDNAGPIGGFSGATAAVSLDVNQDITCTFTNDTIFRIDAVVAGEGGSVSCSPEFVGKGDSSTCTAVPEDGFRVKDWTGACAGAGSNIQCFLSKITEDLTSTVVFETIPDGGTDEDGDGVVDANDDCPNTPPGVTVDQNGCSIEQLCDCAEAGNHGQYVSCVARTANAFVRAGLIDATERGMIMAEAGQSQCGK